MVRITSQTFSDPRLGLLTHLLGTSREHALGVLVVLWWAFDRQGMGQAGEDEVLSWLNPRSAVPTFNALVGSGYLVQAGGLFKVEGQARQRSVTRHVTVVKPSLPVEVPTVDLGTARFIGAYIDAIRGRYGPKARPEIGGKTQGEIKRFLAGTPVDRAVNLVQVYLQMDDPWFETKGHDFTTFTANLQKIGLALDTGAPIGKRRRGIEEILADT